MIQGDVSGSNGKTPGYMQVPKLRHLDNCRKQTVVRFREALVSSKRAIVLPRDGYVALKRIFSGQGGQGDTKADKADSCPTLEAYPLPKDKPRPKGARDIDE